MAVEYSYQRLDYTNANIFRVLTILPGRSDTVKCTLTTAALSTDHICLSYRWSNVGEKRAITLNGEDFRVNQNVWDFLHMAKEKYPNQKFWIDAICIDQANVHEKNHQVPQMGKIYSQSKEVLVWLWPRSASIENAMSLVRNNTLPVMLVPHKVGEPWYFLKWPALPMKLKMAKVAPSTISPTIDIPPEAVQKAIRLLWTHGSDLITQRRKQIDDLETLFGDPYWTRAWIVQEILSNTKVAIMNGDTVISWHDVIDYSALWQRVSQTWEHGLVHNSFGTIQAWPFSNKNAQIQDQRIIELMQVFATQKCQDFHDNVYALRALARDKHRIRVDYALGIEDFLLQILPILHNARDSLCFFDGIAVAYVRLKVIEELKRMSIIPHPDRYGRWSLDWHRYSFPFDEDDRPFLVFSPKTVHLLEDTSHLAALRAAETFGWRAQWNRADARPLREMLESWSSRGTILTIHNHAFFLFTPETETTMRCLEFVVPYYLHQTTLWKCHAVFTAEQISGVTARQVNKFMAYHDSPEWAIELTHGATFRFFMITESKERHKCENHSECSIFSFMA